MTLTSSHEAPGDTSDNLGPESHHTSRHAMLYLYASHFLSTWLSRGFEFGAVLFLARSYPGSLLELSLYAIFRALSAIVCAPIVAKYIDRGDRLMVIRQSILWQRASVTASCLFFWPLLHQASFSKWSPSWLLCGVILLAGVEKLASMACTISVERDWVIVIANDDSTKLETINSQMRRIDLFCKLISPVAIALLEGASTKIAIIYIAGTNVIFAAIEYSLIKVTFQSFPRLADKVAVTDASSSRPISDIASHNHLGIAWFRSWYQSCKRNVVTYVSQDAFYPSLCLSALYLTSLSFGGQMVAFLLAMGFSGSLLALLRVGSTICELSATWLAPWLMARVGVIRAGLWFLNGQVICLCMAIVPLWIAPTSFTALLLFVCGVALSRVGLWGFDLSSQVFIQSHVHEADRAAFSTTEWALQSIFELATFLITAALPDVHQFKISATISFCSVAIAASLYARFVYAERGHLFHGKKRI
ncbi:Ferroporti-1 [Protomyces lactucae-debilis]|uniref:Solute carrier family 40 member n=1 Tax=Protomyces lactucae-debilis TaxID=2754530 RepID=A0A1Y2EW69_PROLT|nr:Ferroporti-1 [Protomyces lactucae-debilis]ORY75747.1 Ferroporti-1 [Protomyces lactucae-debilis]